MSLWRELKRDVRRIPLLYLLPLALIGGIAILALCGALIATTAVTSDSAYGWGGGNTTTLGNGSDPSNTTIAPGGAATDVDSFTFQTNSSTDAVDDVTVSLSSGTYVGISKVEITNSNGTTVYGSVNNPSGNSFTINLTTNTLNATTSSATYRIRITPLSHAAMPAPPGASYAVTARISNFTPHSNSSSGSDSAGTTVTIDNLSPGNVTGATASPDAGQVSLSWTNPGDADLSKIIVLRRTVSAVTDTPTEGTSYSVGNTIGSSTVACVVSAPGASCTDTGLTNGTAYYYKIFTQDTSGNYSANGATPTGSPATPGYTLSGTVYGDEGVTALGSGKTVHLIANGTDSGTTVTTNASGIYSFTGLALSSGQTVLVYIDGDATYKGIAVTVIGGASITNLDIYAGDLITRHDNGGNLTNALLSTAKGASAATDIHYSVSGGALTVSGSDTLYLPSGHSFAPGGAVTATTMKSAGTFNGGSGNAAVTVNGALTVSAGSFTATNGTTTVQGNLTISSGTFTHNSGTFSLTGATARTVDTGSAALNNLIINTTTTAITVNNTVTVSGNLTLTAYYQINGGTIAVAGNITTTKAAPSHSSSGTLMVNGTGAQTLGASGGTGTIPGLTINKASGTLTLQDTILVQGSAGWTWSQGTVNAGTSTVDFYGINSQGAAMTVNTGGGMSFNNVAIDMTAWNLTITGTMTVGGNLALNSVGVLGGGTIAVAGDVTTTAPAGTSPHTATISLNGTGTQTLSAAGGTGVLPGISISKTSGTLNLQDTLKVYGVGWTWTQGTVNAGTSTVWFYSSSNGGSMTVNSGSMSFNNVTVDTGNWNLTVTGTMTVAGDLTLTSATNINTGTIAVAGNLVSTDTTIAGTGSITLNGTGAQSINASGGADLPNGTLTIDKTSGTATLAAALAPSGGMNLTVNQGTLDLAGYNLTGITTLTANASGTLKLQGGETVTATTKTFNSGGTVLYYGSGTYASLAAGNTYSNLTFNNASGSWTHTGTLTAKNLTITAGTLISGGQNISVSGNWSNGGTYTSGANTVTFNGTAQSITGNTTFNNFTKSVASADTLTFAANSTTTINGVATINGASGQLLTLASSSPGTHWNLNLAAASTKAISYVSVSWGDASGSDASKKPVNPTNSTNGGNNMAWFPPIISGTVYTDEGVTAIASGKTIRLIVNGADAGSTTTNGSGQYSITAASLNAGDAVLVYIDNDATYHGNTVTIGNGSDLTGVDIYHAHLITRQDNGGSLSNANLGTAVGAYSDPSDILYSVSSNNLTVSGSNWTLYVPSGQSYTPGGIITTPNMSSAGTFNGGSGSVAVSGALTVSAGAFTATSGTTTVQGNLTLSGGTFTHNSGTIAITGTNARTINTGSAQLNNLQINTGTCCVTVTLTGTIDVRGDLTITNVNNNLTGGTLTVAGNVVSTDSHMIDSSTTVTLTGTGSQTISAGGGVGRLPAVTINKPSGTLTLQDTLQIVGNWTYTSGTVNAGTGTVQFASYGSQTVSAAGMSFNNVTINEGQVGDTLTVTGSMTVAGNLTIQAAGTISSGAINVAGNVTTTDTSVDGSSAITFSGNGAQLLSAGGGTGSLPAVAVSKTGGTLTIQDTIKVASDWTYNSGTVDAGSSTVEFNAWGNQTVNAGSMHFNNFRVNNGQGGSVLTITGTATVDGALTIAQAGQMSGGTVQVGGNVVSSDTSVSGSTAITLNGTGAQTIDTTGGGDLPNGTLTINKSAGTATLASNLTLNGTSQSLTVTAGKLDLTGNNLSLTATLTVANGATLQLQGGETITATGKTFNSGSTVIYNGGGTYTSLAAGNTYSNLTFNNAAGSWTHTGTLTANNLSLTAGTLVSGGQNISVSGNWSNAGTYTSGSNTVTFSGTSQSITGNTTFNNFTKSVASADTLTFAASSTQTVTGTLTLNGASGQLLSLRSSSSPTKWNLNVAAGATKAVSYVDVMDGDASASDASQRPIIPGNSQDSGNNVEWFPYPIITVTKVSAVISDPVNGSTNPKRIPGAIIEYTISPANSGTASPDAGTVYVTDAIDNTNLSFYASGGVTFTDGATGSGLSLGTVSYSNTAAPGPYVYTYTPVPDGQGYDGNVTAVKVTTTGTFNHGGTPSASFNLKFRAKVK